MIWRFAPQRGRGHDVRNFLFVNGLALVVCQMTCWGFPFHHYIPGSQLQRLPRHFQIVSSRLDSLRTLAVAVEVLAFVTALIGCLSTSVLVLLRSVLAASSSAGGQVGQCDSLHHLFQLNRCFIQVPVLSSVYQLGHFAPVLWQQFLFACPTHSDRNPIHQQSAPRRDCQISLWLNLLQPHPTCMCFCYFPFLFAA